MHSVHFGPKKPCAKYMVNHDAPSTSCFMPFLATPEKKSEKKTEKNRKYILKPLKPPPPAPPAAISVILRSALWSPLKMWIFQLLWRSSGRCTNGLKLQFSGNIPRKPTKNPTKNPTVDGWNLAITSWYGSLSHYLHGLIDPRWCRISSINSIIWWVAPLSPIISEKWGPGRWL